MSKPQSTSDSKSSADDAAKSAHPPRRRTLLQRLRFAALYAFYVGILCCLATCGYFWMKYDVGVGGKLSVDQLWQIHYPKLKNVDLDTAPIDPEDGHFDILLLGASVLEQIVEPLRHQLPKDFPHPIRIHNLCTAAHTTRDSLLKFQRLTELGAEFDLVIIYHGINEARMNCCKPGDFRNDYAHCGHYESIERHLKAGEAMAAEIAMRDLGNLISLGEPPADLLDYGGDIKTARPFRQNIEAIVRTSQQKELPVLLMTFAWHLPTDYTREEFERKTLDYGVGQYAMPAEVWGRPEHLRATLTAHNQQISSLTNSYDNVLLIDQETLLPGYGRNFSDPCHLTIEGIRRFVDNLLPTILQAASSAGKNLSEKPVVDTAERTIESRMPSYRGLSAETNK